jgi:molecular chaperone DnaK
MVTVSYRLAVDLGTTFTAAAVAENGVPTLLALGNRAMQIPSVHYIEPDGTVLVGEAAERRGASDPSRLVRESKRRIGDPIALVVGGRPFPAEQLAAELLHWVVGRATQRMGSRPDEVVLTHPANWGPYKRGLMEAILASAELPSPSLMAEPTAAAAQYASRASMAVGDRIAVYDLGGGTFDACVIMRSDEGFEVLGDAEGIERLGGIDFDGLIFEHVLASLDGLSELDPDSEDVVLGLTRLRRDCVDAKEALSEDVEATIPVTVPGVRGPVRITRSEVESLVRVRLSDTHEALRKSMRSAGVRAEELSSLVLVGGSSRMPIVGQLLTQEFGLTTSLDTHPKHDVALGALQPAARSAQHPVSPGAIQTPPRTEPDETQSQQAATRPDIPASTGGGEQEPPPPSTPPPSGPLPEDLIADRSPEPADGGSGLRTKMVALAVASIAVVVIVAVSLVSLLTDGEKSPNPSVQPGKDDTSDASPSRTTPAPIDLPRGPALPESELLYVHIIDSDHKQIWAADTQSGKGRRITPVGTLADLPILSPDRRTLIYAAGEETDATLRVIGVDGDEDGDRRLFKNASICPEPTRGAWDPSGGRRRLILACGGDGRERLVVVDADGSNRSVLVRRGTRPRAPSISPDGNWVVYSAEGPDDESEHIWRIRTSEDADPIQLTKNERYSDGGPVWSHASTEPVIAFKRSSVADGEDGRSDLWTMKQDGTDPAQLTNGNLTYYAPSLSPDGKQIAFVSADKNPEQLIRRIVWMDLEVRGKPKPVLTAPEAKGEEIPLWAGR